MGFIIAGHDRRWPGARIPYEVDGASFAPGSAASNMIRDAINLWNETLLVEWVPRNGHADFVRFQTGSACNSPVGRRGGQQAVTCQVGGGFGRGNVIHEMGHTMGLYHEQQRPDRGTFVTVTGTGVNYDIPGDGIPVDIYDFASIMHYGNSGLIANNVPAGANMGQRISPSRTDMEAIRFAYPIRGTVTLGDQSDIREALAGHNGNLFLAWKGSGNTNLNVSLSTDGGATFIGKHTSGERSSHAPAIASHNGRLHIAWKGDGNDNLNVAKVDVLANTSGAIFVGGLVDKVTLGETSDLAPALASHGGRLFLAWKGSGNDNLNLAFSDDGGVSFGGKMTFGETSNDSPALVSHGGRLYLAWRGSGNENLNLARVDFFGNTSGGFGINGLSNKVTLGETSDFSPALASDGGAMYMAWRGSGNEDLNVITTVDGLNFFDKRISFESSSDAPCLASIERRVFYGWKGANNDNLNVGTVTTVIRPVGHAQNGNLVHGTSGNKGNFEVVLTSGNLVQHYSRNNDAAGVPWSAAAPPPQPGGRPVSSCLLQSRAPSFDLAAVHQTQPVAGPARLEFAQNLNSGGWSAPAPIVADGAPVQGVTGKPSMLQGTFGAFGNFELAVPVGARIEHYWRDNDAAGTPWHGPAVAADFPPVPGAVPVVPIAVSMVQSSFGRPGNLEFVARMRGVPPIGTPHPDYLVYGERDASGWQAPRDLVVNGARVDGVTGDPSLIWSTFGEMGNLELVVPIGLRLVHYWRDNDRLDRPWAGPVVIHDFPRVGPLAGRPIGVSLAQGRYNSPGNLELIVRVDPRLTPFHPPGPHFLVFFFRDAAGGWNGPFPVNLNGGGAITNITGF